MAKILCDFHNKEKAECRRGFAKTLDYYLNELKFNHVKIIEGLNEEINLVEKEMERINTLNLDELAILMDRVWLSNE